MMREAAVRQNRRAGGRAGSNSIAIRPAVRPTSLTEISPLLQRMVIIGEDSRFWTHHGIDPVEMADAMGIEHSRGARATVKAFWRHRDRMRGASTITQQLAKNLYLSPSRNLARKLKEVVMALRLELALPKSRILELYLSVAEWGPGIWGIQAASHTYFGVPASQLDERAAAALAATLPHPTSSNPAHRPDVMLVRRDLILARFHGADVYVPPTMEEPDSAMNGAPVIEPVVDSLMGESPRSDSTEDTIAPAAPRY